MMHKLLESCMKKPKYIHSTNWEIINRPDCAFQRIIFGFVENIGEIVNTPNGDFRFCGTFKRKKDAHAEASTSSTKKVHPYLYGRYRRGWTVLEKIAVDNGQ